MWKFNSVYKLQFNWNEKQPVVQRTYFNCGRELLMLSCTFVTCFSTKLEADTSITVKNVCLLLSAEKKFGQYVLSRKMALWTVLLVGNWQQYWQVSVTVLTVSLLLMCQQPTIVQTAMHSPTRPPHSMRLLRYDSIQTLHTDSWHICALQHSSE